MTCITRAVNKRDRPGSKSRMILHQRLGAPYLCADSWQFANRAGGMRRLSDAKY